MSSDRHSCLVPQKTTGEYGQVTAIGDAGSFSAQTELMEDVTALAERALSDRSRLSVKASARAVVKYAMAEGAGRGGEAAAGKDAGPLVGLLVGSLEGRGDRIRKSG